MDENSDISVEPSTPAPAFLPGAADEVTPSRNGRHRAKAKGADWIEGRLRSLYDAVAAEPLTPELQELVDKLRSRP